MSGTILHFGLAISIQARQSFPMPVEPVKMRKNKTSLSTLSIEIPRLIESSLEGDMTATEQLYLFFFNDIFRFVYRMYPVKETVEEIVNDTFFLAFRRLDTLKDHSAFKSWLLSIAMNRLRNRRKTEKKTSRQIQDNEFETPSWDSHLMKTALEQAINTLPCGYRDVFILHDAEGFTHADISKILGISEGTSKSQLFKARSRLREMLLNNKKKRKAPDTRED